MQLNYLCEFVELAKCKNYAIAADNLFISESSLSRHIKKLEGELGFPLFQRSTRRVELTEFGQEFLFYAEKAAQLKAEIEAVLSKHRNDDKTQLMISAISTFDKYLPLSEWLPEFHAQYPGTTLDIKSPTAATDKMLQSSPSSICFVPELMGHENTNYQHLTVFTDQLVAIVPNTHVFAKRAAISFADLRDEYLVLLSNNTPMFELCSHVCEEYGFSPSVRITGDGRYMRDAVRQGMGVALLLGYPLQTLTDNEGLTIRTFEPPVVVNLNLVYSANASTSAKRYIAFIKRFLEKQAKSQ